VIELRSPVKKYSRCTSHVAHIRYVHMEYLYLYFSLSSRNRSLLTAVVEEKDLN
jgi:hypothetical protein